MATLGTQETRKSRANQGLRLNRCPKVRTSACAVAPIQTLAKGWSVLDANFRVLVEAEDVSQFNAFTLEVLSAAKSDWDNLVSKASQLR